MSQPCHPRFSVFTNSYVLSRYGEEVIFIGAGTGLDLCGHPDLSRRGGFNVGTKKPVSILLPNLDQSMIGGLVSSHLLREMEHRLEICLPSENQQTLDAEVRNIFDWWGFQEHPHVSKIRSIIQDPDRVNRVLLSLSNTDVLRKWTTQAGTDVLYYPLPSREGALPRRKTLAFRIGDAAFALCGSLVGDDGRLNDACKQLLKDAKHLVVGCTEDPLRSCSTPEEIIQACKDAECRPHIYVVNHSQVNAPDVARKLEGGDREVSFGIDVLSLHCD